MPTGLKPRASAAEPAAWRAPALHPVYLKLLLALLRSRGVDTNALLADAELDAAALPSGDQQIAFTAVHAVVQRAVAATGSPWLGLELGASAQAFSHGAVGYAAVASGSVREALQAVCRFAAIRTHAVHFELTSDRHGSHLYIVESFDLGKARVFILEACLVIVERLLQALVLQGGGRLRYALPWPPPSWAGLYPQYLAGQIDFASATACIHLPDDLLDQACVSADPDSYRSAQRECERKLEESRPGRDLASAVRRRLLACTGDYPTAVQMAQHLHLSPRSLFRRMRSAGISYHAVLDEVRCEQAQWQLQHSDEPIERIAERLGYRDTSNFSRTFRRWTGVTPNQWRERARSPR